MIAVFFRLVFAVAVPSSLSSKMSSLSNVFKNASFILSTPVSPPVIIINGVSHKFHLVVDWDCEVSIDDRIFVLSTDETVNADGVRLWVYLSADPEDDACQGEFYVPVLTIETSIHAFKETCSCRLNELLKKSLSQNQSIDKLLKQMEDIKCSIAWEHHKLKQINGDIIKVTQHLLDKM